MVVGVLCRIPRGMYNDIRRIKNQMERKAERRTGKKKSITFSKAAAEYHRKKNSNFYSGGLL